MNTLLRIVFAGVLILSGLNSYSQMKKYICNGEGKAQGLKFSMNFPGNWTVTDGVRPHILKIFDFEDKKGMVTMTLYVSKLDEAPGKDEIEYVFQKDFILSNPTFNGAKVIEFNNDARIEDLRCMFLTVYFKNKVYNAESYSIFKNNQIYFDKYHLQINFSLISFDQKYETMMQMFNNYNPIFKELMSSLSINSRWE